MVDSRFIAEVGAAFKLNRTIYDSQLAGAVQIYDPPPERLDQGIRVEGSDTYVRKPVKSKIASLAAIVSAEDADPWDYMWVAFTELPGITTQRSVPVAPEHVGAPPMREAWRRRSGDPRRYVMDSLERQTALMGRDVASEIALMDYTVAQAYKVVLCDSLRAFTPLFRIAATRRLGISPPGEIAQGWAWGAAAEYRQLKRHYDATWLDVPREFAATVDAVLAGGGSCNLTGIPPSKWRTAR